MMIRMIESIKHNQQLAHDAFCRTITFTVFSIIGTSASNFRENNE